MSTSADDCASSSGGGGARSSRCPAHGGHVVDADRSEVVACKSSGFGRAIDMDAG